MSFKDKVLMQPEHQAVLGTPLAFSDTLADMLDGEIPLPPILIDDMIYADGQVHTLSGNPGCGKSTLAMWIALDQLMQRQHVTWLDFEAGERQTARRMQAIGITGDMARSHLHYAPFPGRIEQQLGDIAARWPGSLVVIDSMSKALSYAGISENANEEVLKWTAPVVKACKTHQIPVLVIDHIAKGSSDSLFARGASTKLADDDVHWRVNKLEEFDRRNIGLIHLDRKKDREGCLGFDLYYRVGDGRGGLPLTATTGPSSGEDDGSAPPL